MKTKLLSLLFTMVLYTGITTAQTKTWDFSNTAVWPLAANSVGPGAQTIIDNLGLYSSAAGSTSPTNFGAINPSGATFSDGFVGTNRFQMGGAGNTSTTGLLPMPVQRFLFFDVSGPCTVKVWFKTGSSGTVRNLWVTDGTNYVGQGTSNSGGNDDLVILTANYTGGAGKLYIYCGITNGNSESCNLYKVSVTGATVNTTLSSNEFQASTVNVFSNGKQVNVTNVVSTTQVEIYSITGALVKSFSTDVDVVVNDLTAGFYVVNVNSNEGKKAVKVTVR